MEDLDILKHAQGYIEKLAAGINPLTGEAVAETDIVKNERIGKCLAYVNDKLKEMIAAGGRAPRKQTPPPTPFEYAKLRLDAVNYAPDAKISLSDLLRRVKGAYDGECALNYARIAPILVLHELLADSVDAAGKHKFVVTETGVANGMSMGEVNTTRGTYECVLYDGRAQRMVVGLLKELDGK